MGADKDLVDLIDRTINEVIATAPMHLENISEDPQAMQVGDPKEFVYGMIMGMALGMGTMVMTTKAGVPTEEDQIMIREMVHSKIPRIRDQIFK